MRVGSGKVGAAKVGGADGGGGGTTYNQSVGDPTVAPVGVLVRDASRAVAGAVAPAGVLSTLGGKILTGAVSSVVGVLSSINGKVFGGAVRAAGGPVLLQNKAAGLSTLIGATSFTVPLDSAPTPGSRIVWQAISQDNTQRINSLQQVGVRWSLKASDYGTDMVEVWEGFVGPGASANIDVVVAQAPTDATSAMVLGDIAEWSGLENAALDVALAVGGGTSSTPVTPSATPTSGVPVLLLGAVRHPPSFSSGPTGGWTGLVGSSPSPAIVGRFAYLATPKASGSYSTGWTFSGSSAYRSYILAFRAVAPSLIVQTLKVASGALSSIVGLLVRQTNKWSGGAWASQTNSERDWSSIGALTNWATSGSEMYLDTSQTDAPRSPPDTIRFDYTSALPGGSSPGTKEYTLPTRKKVMRVEWYGKLGSNFKGHATGTNKDIHCFLRTNAGGSLGNRLFINNRGSGSNALTTSVSVQGINAIAGLTVGEGGPLSGGGANLAQNVQAFATSRDVWYKFVLEVITNTPGLTDGGFRLYINDVLVTDFTGRVEFVSAAEWPGGTPLWTTVQASPTWGGGGDSITTTFSRWHDHILIQGSDTDVIYVGAIAIAGALVRSPIKVMTALVSSIAGVLSTQFGRTLAGGVASSGALARYTSRDLTGSAPSAGVLEKSAARSLAGAVASIVGVLARSPEKVSGGSVPSAATLERVVARDLTGAQLSAGVLAKLTARSLDGSAASSGTLERTGQVSVGGGSVASAGTLERLISVFRGGAVAIDGILFAGQQLLIGALVAISGSLVRAVDRSLTGAAGSAGALTKVTSRGSAGTVGSGGVLSPETHRSLSGAVAPVGVVSRAVATALAGVVAMQGALVKRSDRLLSGQVASAGVLTKLYGKALTAAVAIVGLLVRGAAAELLVNDRSGPLLQVDDRSGEDES